ncbi:MAG: ATP-dependent DNA ligase, partial [Steroidobacteraceae bacterium]
MELRAKSGKSLTRYFPDVVAMLQRLAAKRFVVDGELLIARNGAFAFDALQLRLHPAESRVRRLAAEAPAQFMAFDLLVSPKGTVLLEQPLRVRRRALEQWCATAKVPDRFVLSQKTLRIETAKRWLRGSAPPGTDGVVAKQSEAPYECGKRAMAKVKPLHTADCVVGGFRYLRERMQVGSLLLGLYDAQGKLDHVGFTANIPNTDRSTLTRRLQALRGPPGFSGRAPGGPSRWANERSGAWQPVKPQLVVEVRFDQITAG